MECCILNGEFNGDEEGNYTAIGYAKINSKARHEIEKLQIEEVIGSEDLPIEI